MYFISGVAETNRAPFDIVEGESEIVAGHMVEYSGMTFALFFRRIREHDPDLRQWPRCCSSAAGSLRSRQAGRCSRALLPMVWVAKVAALLFCFWFRATFRHRYDQLMRLGWKVFIPVTLVWIVVIGAWMQTPFSSGNKAKKIMEKLKQTLKSFLLWELAQVSRSPCGTCSRARSPCSIRKKNAAVAAFPRSACADALRRRRGALHRLQAVRSSLPGDKVINIESERARMQPPHDPLRHRPDQVHLLRPCEEACLVDAIVETPIFEYHGEQRGDLYCRNRCCLQPRPLSRRCPQRKAADAKYRRRRHDPGSFYLFAAILVLSALRVVTTWNPVHAVLALVLSFFTAAMLWMLLRAEFLAVALVLIYIGAVMVLFLFVVMMLDIRFDAGLRQGFWRFSSGRRNGCSRDARGNAAGADHRYAELPRAVCRTRCQLRRSESARPPVLHPLLPAVPARRRTAARRHDRCDRADAQKAKATRYQNPAEQVAVSQTACVGEMAAEKTPGRRYEERMMPTLTYYLGPQRRAVRDQRVRHLHEPQNLIVMLMAIELMLLAVNMNFVAFTPR